MLGKGEVVEPETSPPPRLCGGAGVGLPTGQRTASQENRLTQRADIRRGLVRRYIYPNLFCSGERAVRLIMVFVTSKFVVPKQLAYIGTWVLFGCVW